MPWRETRGIAAIAIVTVVVSLLITLMGAENYAAHIGGFIPAIASGAAELPPEIGAGVPWWLTPVTATLIHGGFLHLGLNLVMLVYCGQQTEKALGTVGVVILYLVGAYVAALGQWVQGPDSDVPMIGASGAISAIVAAYAIFYGDRRAKALGPIPAGAVHVAWLAAAWIGIQLLIGVAGLSGSGPQIAIGAHIGGFIAGLVLAKPLLLWRYRSA